MMITKTNILKTVAAWLLATVILINKLSIVASLGFLPTYLAVATPLITVGLIAAITCKSLQSRYKANNSTSRRFLLYANFVKSSFVNTIFLSTTILFYSSELALVFYPINVWLILSSVIFVYGCISYAQYFFKSKECKPEFHSSTMGTEYSVAQADKIKSLVSEKTEKINVQKVVSLVKNDTREIGLREPLKTTKSVINTEFSKQAYTTPNTQEYNKEICSPEEHLNISDASTVAASPHRYETPSTANTKKLYGAETNRPESLINRLGDEVDTLVDNIKEDLLVRDVKGVVIQKANYLYTFLFLFVGIFSVTRYNTLVVNNTQSPEKSSLLSDKNSNKINFGAFKIPLSKEKRDTIRNSFE